MNRGLSERSAGSMSTRVLEFLSTSVVALPFVGPTDYFYDALTVSVRGSILSNTSAVDLTDTLAPEEPANLLLLGCGDPRNILLTIDNQADNSER